MKLRDACPGDRRTLLEWRADPDARAASFDRSLPTPSEHAAWFERELADPARLCWILEIDGIAGGQMRFGIAAREASLGCSLAPAFRGQGLASPFVTLALDRLRATWPRLRSVIADVRSENVASSRTFERSGFALATPDAASRAARPGIAFVRYRLMLG